MKRITLLICSVLFLALPAARGHCAEVRLVVDEWPPFVSKDLPGHGFAAEIVTEAFAAAGISAHIEFMPWKRCETTVRNGGAFASFPYARTGERAESFDFSDAFLVLQDKFFFLEERFPGFEFQTLDDLRPMLIGGAIGYHYEARLAEAGLHVEYASTSLASFRKLLAGRVDVVLEEEMAGRAIVAELLPGREDMVAVAGQPFSVNENCLLVSKTYPDADATMRAFNRGLRIIKADGRYESILRKHGLAP